MVSLSTFITVYLLTASYRSTGLRSTKSIRELNKIIESLRISECILAHGFFHRYSHQQLLDRYLKLFTAQGAGDLWNCQYLIRHMMRRDIGTQLLLYPLLEVLIQLHTVS